MRELTIEDVRDLAIIRKESFEDFWSEQEFVTMLTDDSYFGFREDNGFILCRKAPDCIDIVTFCVAPQYRKKGIGRRLLMEVIRFAEENNLHVFLEVAERNSVAQSLYKSVGFKQVSVRKNYYKFADGLQSALVMKR